MSPHDDEATLVQTDLLGHDFYVFENATTGLINVVYHRKNGGYRHHQPRIETWQVKCVNAWLTVGGTSMQVAAFSPGRFDGQGCITGHSDRCRIVVDTCRL